MIVGDLVFFSTLETETYAARISDGEIVWRYGLGKYSPGIATERTYYFSLNGMLVAFRGRDAPTLTLPGVRLQSDTCSPALPAAASTGCRRRQSGERCMTAPTARHAAVFAR